MEIDGDVMTEFPTLSSQAHAIGSCVFELGCSKMCKDDNVKSVFLSDVSDQDSLNGDMLIMGSPSKNHYSEKTSKNLLNISAGKNLYRTNNRNISSVKNHLLPAWNAPHLLNVNSPKCKVSSNVKLESKFFDSDVKNGDIKVSSFLQKFSSCGGESNIGKVRNAVSDKMLDSITAIYDSETISSSVEELHSTISAPKAELLKGCGALDLSAFAKTDVTIKLKCDIVDQYSNESFPNLQNTNLVPHYQKLNRHHGADSDAKFTLAQIEHSESPADIQVKTETDPWSDERIMPHLIPSSSETVIYIDDDDEDEYENFPREKSQEVIDVASSPEMPTLIPFTLDDINIKVEQMSDFDETSLSKDAADSQDGEEKTQPHVLLRRMSLEDCASVCSFKDKDEIISETAAQRDSSAKGCLNKVPKKSMEKPIMDKIDGLQFFSFKSKKAMEKYMKIHGKKLFAKLQIGKMKVDDREMIVPTKTTDITQIKGWQNKYFAPESQFRSLVFECQSPIDRDNGFKMYEPLAGHLKFSDRKFMDLSSNMSYSDDEQLYSSELLEVDKRFEAGESSKKPSSLKFPGSNKEKSGDDKLLKDDDQPIENDQPMENDSTDKNGSTEKNNQPKDNDTSEKKDSSETNGSPPKDAPSKSGDYPQKSNEDDLPKKEDSTPKKFPKKEKASRDSTPEREIVPKKEDSPKKTPHSAFISEALDKFLETESQLNVSFLQKINPNITPVPPDASILSIGNLRKKDPGLRFQLLKRKKSIAFEDKKEDFELNDQMDVDNIPYLSSSTEEDIPVAQLKAIKRKPLEMPKTESIPKRIKKTSPRTPSEDSNSQRLVLRLRKEADDYKVADVSPEKCEGDNELSSSSDSDSSVIESYKAENKGLIPVIKRTIFAKKEEPKILDEFINNLNMLGTRKDVTMLLQTNQSYFNQAPAINKTVVMKALGALISNEMFEERKAKRNSKKKVKSWEKYLPKKTDDAQKMKLAIKNFKRKSSDVTDGESSVTGSRPQSKRAVKLPAHLENNEGYFDWILSQSTKKRSPQKSSQQKLPAQKRITSERKEIPPLSCDTIISQSIEVTCVSKPLPNTSKSPESLSGSSKSPKSALQTPRKRRNLCSKCVPCARVAVYKKGSKRLACVCRKKNSTTPLTEKKVEKEEMKIVQLSIVEQESPKKLHTNVSDAETEKDVKKDMPIDFSKSSLSKTSELVNNVTKLNLSVKLSETDTLSSLLNKLSNMRSDVQESNISSKSSETNKSDLKSNTTTTTHENICEADKLSSASPSNTKDSIPEANINSKPSELIDSANGETSIKSQIKIIDAPKPSVLIYDKSDSAQVVDSNKTDASNRTTSVPPLPPNKYFVILPVQKSPTKPGSNLHLLPTRFQTTGVSPLIQRVYSEKGLSSQVVSSGAADAEEKLKIIQLPNPNVADFKSGQTSSYGLPKVVTQPPIRNVIPSTNSSTMMLKSPILLNIGKGNGVHSEVGTVIRPLQKKQSADTRMVSHNGLIPVPGAQRFQTFNFKLGEKFVLYPPVIKNDETTARAGIIWPQSSKANESSSKIPVGLATQAVSLPTTSVATQSASLAAAFVSSPPKSCSLSTTSTQTLSCSETSAATEPASCNIASDAQPSSSNVTSNTHPSFSTVASDMQPSSCNITSIIKQLTNAPMQSTLDSSKTVLNEQPVVSSSVTSGTSPSESVQTQTAVNRSIYQGTPDDYHNYSKKEIPTSKRKVVQKKRKKSDELKLKDCNEVLIDIETLDESCNILHNLKKSCTSSGSSSSSSSSASDSTDSTDSEDSTDSDIDSMKKKSVTEGKNHKSEKERHRRIQLNQCFEYLRSTSKHFKNATSLVDTLRMAIHIVDLEKKREETYKLAKRGLQLRNMALLKKSMFIAQSFTNPVERDLAKLQTIHTLAMAWAKHHPNEGNLLSALVSKGKGGSVLPTAAKNSEKIGIDFQNHLSSKGDALESQDSQSNEAEISPQIEIFNYYSVNREPNESKCPNVVMQCKEKPGRSSELKNLLLSNISQNSNSSDVLSSNSSDKTSFMQRLRDKYADKSTPKSVQPKNKEIKSDGGISGNTSPVANAVEDDGNLSEDPLIIDLSNDSIVGDKNEEVQENTCTDVEKVPEKILLEASKDIVPKRQFPGLIPLFPQTPVDIPDSLGSPSNSSHSSRLHSTVAIKTINQKSITATSTIPSSSSDVVSFERTVTCYNTSITNTIYYSDAEKKFPDLICRESLEECERLGTDKKAYPGLTPLDSPLPENIFATDDRQCISNSSSSLNKGQIPTSFTDVLKSNSSESGELSLASESKPLSLCKKSAADQKANENTRPLSVSNGTEIANRSRSPPEEITIDDGDDSQEMPSLSPNRADVQSPQNSATIPASENTGRSSGDINLSSSPDIPLNLSTGRNVTESETRVSSSNQKELERRNSHSIPEEITIDDSDEEEESDSFKSATVCSAADTTYETIEDSDDEQQGDCPNPLDYKAICSDVGATETCKTIGDNNESEQSLIKSSEALVCSAAETAVDCETIEDSSDDEDHCNSAATATSETKTVANWETIEDSDEEHCDAAMSSETTIILQRESKQATTVMCPTAEVLTICETIEDSDDEQCDSSKLSTEKQLDTAKSLSADQHDLLKSSSVTEKQQCGSEELSGLSTECSAAQTSKTCTALKDSEQLCDSQNPAEDSTVSSTAEATKTIKTAVANQDSDSNDIIEIQCSRSSGSSAVS